VRTVQTATHCVWSSIRRTCRVHVASLSSRYDAKSLEWTWHWATTDSVWWRNRRRDSVAVWIDCRRTSTAKTRTLCSNSSRMLTTILIRCTCLSMFTRQPMCLHHHHHHHHHGHVMIYSGKPPKHSLPSKKNLNRFFLFLILVVTAWILTMLSAVVIVCTI